MRQFLSLAVLLAGLGTLSAAPVPGGAPLSGAEKVRKALEQPVSLELTDQPIRAALSQLRDLVKVNFVLDRMALLDLLIEEELTVSVNVKQTKAGSVLRLMLAEHNLVPVISGEMVVITTPEAAIQRQVRQRVHIDLDNVPLLSALRQLARHTAVNLMLDPRLGKEGQAPITLQLEDVPLETAVKLLAEIAGLKAVRVGNVLFVTTEARADRLQEPDNGVLNGSRLIDREFGPGMRGIGIVPVPAPAAPAAPPPPAPKQ